MISQGSVSLPVRWRLTSRLNSSGSQRFAELDLLRARQVLGFFGELHANQNSPGQRRGEQNFRLRQYDRHIIKEKLDPSVIKPVHAHRFTLPPLGGGLSHKTTRPTSLQAG